MTITSSFENHCPPLPWTFSRSDRDPPGGNGCQGWFYTLVWPIPQMCIFIVFLQTLPIVHVISSWGGAVATPFRHNPKFPSATYKSGLWTWFALQRLNTTSKNSAHFGGFWNHFIYETSQVDGRTRNWTMKRPHFGPLRLRNSPTGAPIQNG